MTLAEDVLKRHIRCCDQCHDCNAGCPSWPCDAYRLAVIVRDIEARLDKERFVAVLHTGKCELCALTSDLRAITREEKP